jgi:hypothetical protein
MERENRKLARFFSRGVSGEATYISSNRDSAALFGSRCITAV